MRVLHVASEAYPLVKTGGLADVAGPLPAAQVRLGVDARLLLPGYPDALRRLEGVGEPVDLGELLPGLGPTRLIQGRMPDTGLPVWLVDHSMLYDRPGGLYLDLQGDEWPDNHLRFGLLGRVGARMAGADAPAGWRPELVHAHDWHAGLAPAYLALGGTPRPATVFSVHNIAFSGKFARATAAELGIPPSALVPEGLEFYGDLSFLKAGLYYADRLATVSPTYAGELLTPAGGMGFDVLLRHRADELVGILNGIDEQVWDPSRDPSLSAPYDADSLDRKARNKAVLQQELGLAEDPRAFLSAFIGRLTLQKGIDLLLEALPGMLAGRDQVVVLGSGERLFQEELKEVATHHPDRLAVRIGYDEPLAHRIQAGADLFLMPSRFEPCGLTQMYALRYGTPPLVRRTGGLADTVVDAALRGQGTGFLFDEPDPAALLETFQRARRRFRDRKSWRALQRRCMVRPSGWGRAAARYLDLYQKLVP
jgi:starch synthase